MGSELGWSYVRRGNTLRVGCEGVEEDRVALTLELDAGKPGMLLQLLVSHSIGDSLIHPSFDFQLGEVQFKTDCSAGR